MPTILAQGALNAQLGALEGRRAPQGSSGGGGSGRNADQVAQSSGLSSVNSSQSVRIVAPGVPDNFGSGPGPRNRNPNDTIVTAFEQRQLKPCRRHGGPGARQQQQPQQHAAAGGNAGAASAATADVIPDVVPDGRRRPQPPAGTTARATVLNLPQTGTVTYVGDMVGSGTAIRRTGSYQNAWNFGTRSGSFSATFDGARFQGTTFANGNSRTFNTHGPVASSNTNRQMELNGSFFGRAASPSYQVGVFNVTGATRHTVVSASSSVRSANHRGNRLAMKVGDAGDVVAPEPRQASDSPAARRQAMATMVGSRGAIGSPPARTSILRCGSRL